MKSVFIHITKSIPLLSQQRFPFVLGATNYFPVASEGDSFTWLQNQRTGAGGVEGGRRGGGSREQKEKNGDTQRRREAKKERRDGRGRAVGGGG